MLNFFKNKIENKYYLELKEYIENVNGKFILVNPKENKFKFPYVLYIPNKIDSTTLILHGNNLACEEGNILNIFSAIMETSIKAGYPLTDLNEIILVPVTSNYIHPANNNMHEFFPMQATRNVVFCENVDNTYYKIFDQITNMLEDAKKLLKEKYNIYLEDKIICHGFSSSAKFVLRYAAFNPKKVSLVIAGGFGAQAIVPLKELKGEKLLYPIGVYDIDFDLENFKKIRQFFYMGELENENNDTAMNFRHTDEEIKNIYVKVFGENIWDRFYELEKIYKELGYSNVTFKKYKNYGHSATPGEKETTNLIKKYRK